MIFDHLFVPEIYRCTIVEKRIINLINLSVWNIYNNRKELWTNNAGSSLTDINKKKIEEKIMVFNIVCINSWNYENGLETIYYSMTKYSLDVIFLC